MNRCELWGKIREKAPYINVFLGKDYGCSDIDTAIKELQNIVDFLDFAGKAIGAAGITLKYDGMSGFIRTYADIQIKFKADFVVETNKDFTIGEAKTALKRELKKLKKKKKFLQEDICGDIIEKKLGGTK